MPKGISKRKKKLIGIHWFFCLFANAFRRFLASISVWECLPNMFSIFFETKRFLMISSLCFWSSLYSSFSSSNLSEKKRSLLNPLRMSATTCGGVLAPIKGTGFWWWICKIQSKTCPLDWCPLDRWENGFSVSSRARTVWAAKPRVPQPDTGKPICSTAERVRSSFLFLLSVHTERRKYMNIY